MYGAVPPLTSIVIVPVKSPSAVLQAGAPSVSAISIASGSSKVYVSEYVHKPVASVTTTV